MKWKILPVLWLATKRTATALGFLMLINIALALLVLPAFMPQKGAVPSLPSEMVLYVGFEGGFHEMQAPPDFADPFAPPVLTLREMIDALDRAAGDERVKGLVARMYDGAFSLSQTSELRAALKRFREAGKFAHIYATSYGEGGGGLGRYYLASAFDEIWMQPLGVVEIAGVNAEMPFFREVLDKVGVSPQFFQRKEYKTAYENLTNKAMSAENRETIQKIVNDIRFEVLERIPEERGMSAPDFERLVNKGLFTAAEAEKAGLITHADYGDVLLDNIAESVTGERDVDQLELVDLEYYKAATQKKHHGLIPGGKPKVALIYAAGVIMPSADGGAPSGFGGEGIAAADELAPAILDAANDDAVEAIILRIDSPGGSPSASESILRAVEKAQEKGKPVIVSMGTTAASGGYWIAAYADKIYALPMTLTGSIGVVGGKFALGEMFEKLGVKWERVSWGRNAGLWSLDTPFDKSEAARINAMLDNVYDNFIARVAKGRDMSPEAVDKIAGGRVWSGRRALDVGLVDELGGLEDALDYTATLVGGESRKDLNIVQYPPPKTALDLVLDMLGAQVRMGGVVSEALAPLMGAVSAVQSPQNFMTYEPLSIAR